MQFDAICTLRHHKHNHACYVTIDTRTVCNLHWSSWFLGCLHMQEIQWNSYSKNVVPGTTACSCWICWKPEIALSLFLEANFRRIRRWRVYHSSYPMETDFYIALIIYWYNIDIMNFIMCMNKNSNSSYIMMSISKPMPTSISIDFCVERCSSLGDLPPASGRLAVVKCGSVSARSLRPWSQDGSRL